MNLAVGGRKYERIGPEHISYNFLNSSDVVGRLYMENVRHWGIKLII